MKNINEFIEQIKSDPEVIEFANIIALIENYYQYIPMQFSNGIDNDRVINKAGENEGSCKIFAFAQLQELNKNQTLNCFGQYYRSDVLNNPDNTDHANIRTFMKYGWQGINFNGQALSKKIIP